MGTRRYDETELKGVAKALKAGELVAFPTGTMYGLGANALLPNTVRKVFSVRRGPQDNPLVVHVASFEQVKEHVNNFHSKTEKIVKNFWPRSLTLIFKIGKGTLLSAVTGGLSMAASHMPDNRKILEIIEPSGIPLVGPSTNTSGKPGPATVDHMSHDLRGKTTRIINDGTTRIGVESTIPDLGGPTAMSMILRPGAVTGKQIETTIESPVAIDQHLVKESETPKALGMKYKHYSPDTCILMVREGGWSAVVQWAKNKKIRMGVIASPEISDQVRTDIAAAYMYSDNSVEAVAKGLFAGLRGLDEPALGLDLVFVQAYPETGLGNAYMNHLKRATGQNYFEE